ncbi:MAG: FMN-binding protein, partial [Clostridia bacterium]|nr:FMN-binding protein [Clostridia bacterium]
AATDTKAYEVTGFAPFKVEIGVDADGKITSITIPENSETPGLGADLIADAAVFEALIGQDIKDAQIDVRAGVTLTSNAINDALKQAAAEIAGVDETAAAADTKAYEVKGFESFKVEIGVDADGKITSITIPENSETPGLGADLIADTAVFEALIGQSIKDAQIDVRAGVTLTSNAINDALKQASEEVGK